MTEVHSFSAKSGQLSPAIATPARKSCQGFHDVMAIAELEAGLAKLAHPTTFSSEGCPTGEMRIAVNNLVVPGGALAGMIELSLQKPVPCCGLHMHIVGTEHLTLNTPAHPNEEDAFYATDPVRRTRVTYLAEEYCCDVRVGVNNAMASRVSSSCHLHPDLPAGTLSVPFALPIPAHVPPSYFIQYPASSPYVSSSLVYVAEAYLVDHHGHVLQSPHKMFTFTVAPALPQAWYYHLRGTSYSLFKSQFQRCVVPFVICRCCKVCVDRREDRPSRATRGYISTRLQLFQEAISVRMKGEFNVPPLPVLECFAPESSPVGRFMEGRLAATTYPNSSEELIARVELANATDCPVTTIEVELIQCVKPNQSKEEFIRSLYCVRYVQTDSPLLPSGKARFELPLRVPAPMEDRPNPYADCLPVPSIHTPLCSTRIAVRVGYPELNLETVFDTPIVLCAAVDESDTVPSDNVYHAG